MDLMQHIQGLAVFWMLSALALALFAFSAFRRIRPLRSTQPLVRTDRPLERIKGLLVRVFGQKKIFYDPVPGLAHALIFWGFCVISIESVQFFLSAFGIDARLPFTAAAFHAVYEIALVLVLASVAYALGRRLFFRTRVVRSVDGLFVLALIVGLAISGLILSSQETALSGEANPWKVVTNAFHAAPHAGLANAAWWIHGLIFLGFLNYLPYSKHFHVLTVPFNVYFRDLGPPGRLPPLDLENAERFGLADRRDMTFKDILDGYTCTECGRCTAVCPANLAGKHLDPKEIVLGIRRCVVQGETRPLLKNHYDKVDIFDCTTCHACVTACPVENEHLSKILRARQNLILMEGDMPDEYERTFRNLETNANPWGMASSRRGEWPKALGLPTLAEKPNAEYVYFLGCAACYDTRVREIAKSFAHVMNRAGVDFAVLGDREFCCGDHARRMGNEYLFQEMIEANRQVIEACGLAKKKIITTDSHCFNVLKNEYPDFGIQPDVEHHSTFLHRLLSEGGLMPKRDGTRSLVFHDSCYLGRYNAILDEPRQVLAMLGHRVVEMEHAQRESMCCGAGGGRMFMEEEKDHRVNVMRAREAIAARGDDIVVACPYCALMLEDGLKQLESGRKVYDLAEVVAASLPEHAITASHADSPEKSHAPC